MQNNSDGNMNIRYDWFTNIDTIFEEVGNILS